MGKGRGLFRVLFCAGGGLLQDCFSNKSEDLYAKNSLIYFVMQVRGYNPTLNADVKKQSSWMNVDITSATVDLSLATRVNGGTVVTVPANSLNMTFGSAVKAVTADQEMQLLSYNAQKNQLFFDIEYRVDTGVNQYSRQQYDFDQDGYAEGVMKIEIADGKNLPAYTDYYLGFVGLTKNEITAKGSVVANIGYNGDSEKFVDDVLTVVKGDRTYMIRKVNADSWAQKTQYVPTGETIGTPIGYAVFVKVSVNGVYNYVAQA